MPSQNQPDIEIYVKTKDGQIIKNWLERFFNQTIDLVKNGDLQSSNIQYNSQIIPVNIMLNAQGGYSSLWFDSEHTDWLNDLECAKAFVNDTKIEARCIKSSWAEDEVEDPDCWLQIEKDSISEINWK
ncbi:MAG: hypothetical protein HRU38_18390 [Saccharospirillaceae bacterium]|nr:hypothetical protein [Pseudomonadales bacterium]NRB80607.1 hypothetical protein [Saccharospirillaceae bacterium]